MFSDSEFPFIAAKMLIMKYINIVFICLLILSACDPNATNSGNQDANNDVDTTKNETTQTDPIPSSENKWICIPNKQVGLIEADADEEAIIAAYGKDNVIREEVGIGEGEYTAATIVFPNSPNELIVEWQEGLEYKKLSRIRIEQANAKWKTEEGIKIGTTLDELIEINGKDFKFYGFDWDYGGTTNDWEGGNVNPQLAVFLDTKNPEGAPQELAGDGLFSSSNPKAKEANLEVVGFVIYFGL